MARALIKKSSGRPKLRTRNSCRVCFSKVHTDLVDRLFFSCEVRSRNKEWRTKTKEEREKLTRTDTPATKSYHARIAGDLKNQPIMVV